jgi:hypothetical protein
VGLEKPRPPRSRFAHQQHIGCCCDSQDKFLMGWNNEQIQILQRHALWIDPCLNYNLTTIQFLREATISYLSHRIISSWGQSVWNSLTDSEWFLSFPYFEKMKVGLWDHVAVCVCVCLSSLLLLGNDSVKVSLSLLGNGSVKIPLSLLGNGSVKIPLSLLGNGSLETLPR